MTKRDPRAKILRTCRGCGCDDDHACVFYGGPCFWVLLDIDTATGVCSACAVEVEFDRELLADMGRDPLDPDGHPLVLQQPPALIRASG